MLPFLVARLEAINHGSSARGLFTDEWRAAYDEDDARASVETALAGVDLSPADLCTYLYLHGSTIRDSPSRRSRCSGRWRRSGCRSPIPTSSNACSRDRRSGEAARIHQALIRRINPAYLKVRNPNTGAPAGAGPLQEYVLDKVNSVLRRLNVYGYRHYHAFDGWMRKAFLDVVDTVLLVPAALERGIVREQALRRLVDEARQGTSDHDHVLQVLMIVELWQRENLPS